MKKCILSVCVLFLFLSMSEHKGDYDVQWGEYYKVKGYHSFLEDIVPIELNENSSYMLGKGNQLFKYDSKMNVVEEKTLDLTYEKKVAKFINVLRTTQGIFGIFTVDNSKEKSKLILASKFSKGNFGELRLINSLEYPHDLAMKYASSHVYTSENKTRTGFGALRNAVKKENEALRIAIFDENLKRLWKKKITKPFGDHSGRITDQKITDNGEIFLLYEIRKNKEDKSKELPSVDYKLVYIGEDGIIKKLKVDTNGKIPKGVRLFLKPEVNQIILSGSYQEEKGRDDDGIFHSTIDLETWETKKYLLPFPEKLAEKISTAKKETIGKSVATDFSVTEIISHEDRSYTIIAEWFYHYASSYEGAVNNYYFSKDLIIARYDKDGKLLSTELVDKEFKDGLFGAFSYSSVYHNKKIYLLYNTFKDLARPMGLGPKESFKDNLTRYTDLTIIGENGKIESQQTLFTSSDVDPKFLPGYTELVGNKILIGAKEHNNVKAHGFQFGYIDLD